MAAALQPESRIDLVTLGCRLNAAESERMAALAAEAGLKDAIIVNTCAVTNEAVRQSRQAIRKAARARPNAPVIVTGCAAQIDPAAFAAMPEVDRVLGNAEKMQRESFSWTGDEPRVRVADIMSVRETAPHLLEGFSRTRAYVEVQTGCDHRCTFCIIPYGRGNARSVPAGAVIDQVRALAEKGCPEIVLTGVDLTSWGGDLPGAPALGNLVQRILKLVPDLPRLRLSSLDVIEMDDALFEAVAHDPRVAPHLHLSLQHGHDLILKRMKRRHSRAQAIELCGRLKAARPEIALGADLIAGFPTETEAHFETMLDFVDECALSFLHVFPFSPREGTPAALMPQLDRALVKARAARLRDKGAIRLRTHLDGWVGKSADALIETDSFARLPDFTGVRIARSGSASPPPRGEGLGGGGTSDRPGSTPNPVDPWFPPTLALPHEGGGNLRRASSTLRFAAHDGENLIGVAA
ncbi:MAG TPA: tRNA (N(6)-L-threonylcarbamoyladenosine(37)-C(2))-methylthiotransferase MtaB [Caulobacterales bacterium]|nr:tRNA (N(6)-L-threonylcarbamoyladenosine(37)-C(2))-methylthiotransferase MtaB [Caulobacterales bacterium]